MYYGITDIQQIFDTVEEVCTVLGNGGNSCANKLILGTIAAETRFGTYKDPTPFKAGSGLCQMDYVGYKEVINRTREHNEQLLNENFGIDILKVEFNDLEYNPLLSIIFCRLFYKLIPEEIKDDVSNLAYYWKRYYNTKAGKGTKEHFIGNYNHFVRS